MYTEDSEILKRVDELLGIVRKAISRPVIKCEATDEFVCPNCLSPLSTWVNEWGYTEGGNYCSNCGQRIYWEHK